MRGGNPRLRRSSRRLASPRFGSLWGVCNTLCRCRCRWRAIGVMVSLCSSDTQARARLVASVELRCNKYYRPSVACQDFVSVHRNIPVRFAENANPPSPPPDTCRVRLSGVGGCREGQKKQPPAIFGKESGYVQHRGCRVRVTTPLTRSITTGYSSAKVQAAGWGVSVCPALAVTVTRTKADTAERRRYGNPARWPCDRAGMVPNL